MSCVVIFQVSLLVSVAIKRFCGDVPMPQLSDINKQDVSVFLPISTFNYRELYSDMNEKRRRWMNA